MKTLLFAATMAAGVSIGVIPAFAHSAMTAQPGFTTSRNDGVGTMQAQNAAPTPYRTARPTEASERSRAPLWHHGVPWSADNPYNYDNAGG